MKTIEVEVMGVVPPCHRCKTTEDNARQAAAKLVDEAKVTVTKRDITTNETISKYGVLISPAIAVNGVVKIMGKVPDAGVIERLIRKEL